MLKRHVLPLKPANVYSLKFTPSRGGHDISKTFLQRGAVMSPSGGGETRRHYTVVLQGEDILLPQILFYIPDDRVEIFYSNPCSSSS